MSTSKIELGIDGMTCASCTGRVERRLKALEGIGEVSVNLASEQASFFYDTDRIALGDIVQEVAALGYSPIISEIEIGVGGMTCAACSARVERVLKKQPGVISAEVNLATEKAHVSYLPASVDAEVMMRVIASAGYEPRVLEDWKEQEEEQKKQHLIAMEGDVLKAFILTIPVVFLAMGVNWIPGLPERLGEIAPFESFWDWIQFFLTTLVMVFPGRRFFRPGFIAYRHLSPDMNSLVMTGTGAAWLYSSAVLIFPDMFPEAARHVFFESAAVVISVVLLGKYLEERAKGNASRAIRKLLGLQAKTATLIGQDGELVEVDIARIQKGDRVQCKPGARIPVDGIVVEGEGYIDESMLSGEPIPVFKTSSDEVTGGSLNQNGLLVIETTRVGKETVLAQIIKMVEQAQAGKLPIQSIADRVILIFTPLVLAVALTTFLAWIFLGPEPAITYALVAAVAVLVVACPCAMGLATPAAIMVGTGRAAEMGVLFRKGEALERMNKINHVVFDKTGTLTFGKPKLVTIEGRNPDHALQYAASVEQGSEHPLGRAILSGAQEKGLKLLDIQQFQSVPGRGITAIVDSEEVRVGNRAFVSEDATFAADTETIASELAARGETPVFVSRGREVIGVLGITDPVRPESRIVVQSLKRRGLGVSLFTGDHAGPAHTLADYLGIDHVESGLLPAHKAEAVKALRSQNLRVAFVGDGINDAPALVEADVGIAIGSGTDIAIESADVVLMSEDLGHVMSVFRVSQSTVRTIRGNLFWAFIYNILLIPVAAGVLYPGFGVMLNPMMAGVAMGFSSIFVVLNSLRLRRVQAWATGDS